MRETNFTVLGIGKRGKSGLASALALTSLGIPTLVSEYEDEAQYPEEAELLRRVGAEVEFGGHSERIFERQVIVTCPGIKPQAAPLVEAQRRGIPVWSEIELAYRLSPAPIVAITGTNGKTTTTALTASVLSQGNRPVRVGGNIGTPLVSVVQGAPPRARIVAEIGAPQLEHIHHFRPHVAVLLNLSEDHLDRYPDMGAYRRVKSRLVECQTASDRVIRNMDDEWSRETPSWGRSYPFGRPSDEEGAWVEGGAIWICREGKREVVMDCQQLPLPGRANLENALAAVSVGSILGLSTQAIARGLAQFPGVEHRLECVTTIKGVTYLNDSSSTNPLSTIRAMAVVANPTILLLGGSEKGANYSELARVAAHKAKRTILYGATRNRIAQAFHEVENYAFLVEEGDLRAVLERARSLASPGDVVLFSPACASFDMFRDFEHRGEIFRELVLEMEHGHP